MLIGCVKNLASGCAENHGRFATEGGVAGALVACMGAHADDGEATLQEQGCLAIEACHGMSCHVM